MKILVLDNYDSFTYNLVHIIRELGHSMDIFRNDKISLDQVNEYDKIVLSPGPGIPSEAGILMDLIKRYGPTKSILGVCLGHQGIAEAFGGTLYNIPNVLHGVTSALQIVDSNNKLFKGIPSSFQVCHYHSWAVRADNLPPELTMTATNKDGLVMAISHKKWDVCGVQFHPESIMSEHGKAMIQNWLKV